MDSWGSDDWGDCTPNLSTASTSKYKQAKYDSYSESTSSETKVESLQGKQFVQISNFDSEVGTTEKKQQKCLDINV